MICPKCGAETDTQEGRCGVCQADLFDAPTLLGDRHDAPTAPLGDADQATQLHDVDATATIGDLDQASTIRDPVTGGSEGATLDGPTIGGDDVDGQAGETGSLEPGQRFGTRYRVTRLIGEGGMGAVYEAFDNELGVDVALKVIRPEQMGDGKKAAALERRFKRELLLGRKVTHKNVVRIHDIGEIGGIKYITMPFIDGSDLSSVLKKEGGKLPVSRTLRIARSVLSGLTAAHDAGVVHRDMKAANIMIDADDEA